MRTGATVILASDLDELPEIFCDPVKQAPDPGFSSDPNVFVPHLEDFTEILGFDVVLHEMLGECLPRFVERLGQLTVLVNVA